MECAMENAMATESLKRCSFSQLVKESVKDCAMRCETGCVTKTPMTPMVQTCSHLPMSQMELANKAYLPPPRARLSVLAIPSWLVSSVVTQGER